MDGARADIGKAGLCLLTRAVTQLNQVGSNVPQECTYIFGYRDATEEVLDGQRFPPAVLRV